MNQIVSAWIARILTFCLIVTLTISPLSPAWAGLQDDHFDGNIFALYAGNGALIPPKTTLAQSLQSNKPTLLTFFVDDSRDCKQFASVVSRLQGYYGKVSDIIPISSDTLLAEQRYRPDEPGYYFQNVLPQTILFNAQGNIVANWSGVVPFETIDDRYRELFDLLPRSQSVELKRRPLNEINASLGE
ncbi:thylakoid membrane photosystem I accumulation factor [Lyngbya confervoides]|uniref:Thylakoid membrane photosystem I accumulation factor n=1 Tax=Lyngbya confervoides BDU141951 TaxID=1574623 RepID=A0ABD4T2T6_9CYAN|nr:thylakoid membrane photosystem I accumulation factor [Lyngbya confervoides]MCM1982936.1 thylakoid membrane photosystem I accumulation factor [Lyngbya confervoides BDU141951]